MTSPYLVADVDDSALTAETPMSGCGNDCPPLVYADVAEVGECSLTPGDPSPAGRCPHCDGLVYPDRPEDRARDAGPELLALVKAVMACPQAAPWLVRMPMPEGEASVWETADRWVRFCDGIPAGAEQES